MKRVIAIILCLAFILSACNTRNVSTTGPAPIDTTPDATVYPLPSFSSETLNDRAFIDELQYDLTTSLENNEHIIVENIKPYFVPQEYIDSGTVSKEYIDELKYNGLENIYFGYRLSELDAYFGDLQYVFTVENGETVAIPFVVDDSDDVLNTIIKNTAIGAGVILFCVTISIVTGGAGAPAAVSAAHVIFTFAATSAAKGAAIGIASGGFTGAIEIANQLSSEDEIDWNKVGNVTAVGASEGFKWGAIIGAVTGGVSGGKALADAAKIAKEGGTVGTYGELVKAYAGQLKLMGKEAHHIIPKAATSTTAPNDGLAILLDIADHKLLTSTGNSIEAKAFRAEITRRLDAGKIKEAYTMGFDDILFHTGDKYLPQITKAKELTGLY
jgi:hypothetical protein